MDESILRGFCQCGCPVRVIDGKIVHWNFSYEEIVVDQDIGCASVIPSFVLSPKQFYLISERIEAENKKAWDDEAEEHDEEIANYYDEESEDSDPMFMLEKNPFLVAKILSTSYSTEEGVKE